MAHFAELDSNNIVLRVVVIGNDMVTDEHGQESESKGIAFCKQLFGNETIWVQTSYNGRIRKNYAGIGYSYDAQRDAFIAPQPEGNGWILDEDKCIWRNPELEAAQEAAKIEVDRV